MTKLVQNVLTSVENLCQHMDILLLENKKISSNDDDDADMLPYVIRACTTLQDKLRLYRLRTTQITSLPLNSKQEKTQLKRPHLQLLPQGILFNIFSWCDATALTGARKSCKSFSCTHFSSFLPLVDAVAKSICKSQYSFSDINTLLPRSWESWTQILGMLELQRSCIKRSTRLAFEESDSCFIVRNGEVYNDDFKKIRADDDYYFEPISYFKKVCITQVATGNNFRLFLSDKGVIYSSGCNEDGQLGRPDVEEDYADHTAAVLIPDKISYIGAGFEHSICITTDGEIWTFGASEFGQCGHGDQSYASPPVTKPAKNYNQKSLRSLVFVVYIKLNSVEFTTRPIEMRTNGLHHRVVQVLAVDVELYYLTWEGTVYYSVHRYSSEDVVPKFLTKSETNCKVIQIFAGFKMVRFLLSDGSLTRYSRDDDGETDGRLKMEQKFENVEGMAIYDYGGDLVSYITESTKQGELLHRNNYHRDGSFNSEQKPLKLVTNSSE